MKNLNQFAFNTETNREQQIWSKNSANRTSQGFEKKQLFRLRDRLQILNLFSSIGSIYYFCQNIFFN